MSGLVLKTAGAAGILAALALASTGGLSRLVEPQEAEREQSEPAAPAAMPPAFSNAGGPFSVTIAADSSGHFFTEPSVDGVRIRMMVDTGASAIALSFEDAGKAGILPLPSDFTIRVSTANGVVGAAPVVLREVALGDIRLRDVRAMVLERGRLSGSLLGMSFLSRLSRFQVADGRLHLRR